MKTFNLYCDESSHLEHDGMPYMLISYVSSAYNQLKLHKEHIRMLRAKHKYKGEIKWSTVSKGQYPFYNELIEYFFSNDLTFRSVIIQKTQINNAKQGFTYDDFYYRMYYQLIAHKLNPDYFYNIYLDEKDTRGQKKLRKLKEILQTSGSVRNVQFIKSYESSLMQLTDLIMGAINYKLREMDTVIAKRKLIEKIESHSKVQLTKSTPPWVDKFNLFFIDLK